VRLDGEAHRVADGKGAQRAGGGLHLVADAANVDDGVALADGIHRAFELADHGAPPPLLAGGETVGVRGRYSIQLRISGRPSP
jgi:hypothetical protein